MCKYSIKAFLSLKVDNSNLPEFSVAVAIVNKPLRTGLRKKVFVTGLFSSLDVLFLYTGIICSQCLNECKISVKDKVVSDFVVPHAGSNIEVLGK